MDDPAVLTARSCAVRRTASRGACAAEPPRPAPRLRHPNVPMSSSRSLPSFRRLFPRLALAGLAAAATVALPRVAAAYDEGSAAVISNTGFDFGLGPVLLVPTDGGPLGGGLDAELRYGIGLDPVILAPGARVAGYAFSGRFVGLAMPTLRLTLPVGPLAPFVTGGVGGGWLSNPSEAGLALMGGGGLMVHFGRVLGVGVEATYQTVTDTELEAIAVGPMLQFGF